MAFCYGSLNWLTQEYQEKKLSFYIHCVWIVNKPILVTCVKLINVIEKSFTGKITISVQFSCSVMSDSLWPHELQHTRPPCPSPIPGAYPDSLCHPNISSSIIPFPSCPKFPSTKVFSNESALCIRWPKYWSFSFSISPSNEYPGLISLRMDWLYLLEGQGTQESSPSPQFKSINSSVLSFLYSPTLTSICDYWKNHSLE